MTDAVGEFYEYSVIECDNTWHVPGILIILLWYYNKIYLINLNYQWPRFQGLLLPQSQINLYF